MNFTIGFDAKRAFHNKTGLGNYSRTLITTLAKLYPEVQLILFTPAFKDDAIFPEVNNFKNIQIITAPKYIPSAFWRSFLLSKEAVKYNCDIFHGLTGELPKGKWNIPTLVTIHDMIYVRYPNLFKAIDRKIYLSKNKYAVENTTIILANSEQTKKDIVTFLKVEETKIKVVYLTTDEQFNKNYSVKEIDSIKTKYALPDKFILTVGRIEERKNGLLILQSLSQIPDDIQVVFVGKPTDYKKLLDDFIRANKLENRVIFLENIPYEDLPLIYQNAYICAYPSIFEGFGIPVLEATKSRVPLIAGTGSCLEEVGGSNVIYINPDDVNGFANAVNKLDADEHFRKNQIEKSFEFSKRFSVEQMTKDTMNAYLSILN